MLSKPVAVPKPSTRLAERQLRTRERREQERVFKASVWSRDQGRCVVCQRVVKRTLGLDPLRGEVHHRRGRNVAPGARFDPNGAVLVCLADHLLLTLHKISLPPEGSP
jgi:hypothetical protein